MASALRPVSHESGPGRLDVRFYLDLLWRQRALLGTAALVGLLLALVFAYLQTPEYQAKVLLQIEPPPPTFLSVTDALVGGGNYWQNADFYNTQFRVLQSRGLGEKIVDRLNLKEQEPFKSSTDPGGLFMASVQVLPVPESRLVQVMVTDPDPQRAALWANTVADVYIKSSLASRVESAQKAVEWLKEQLDKTQGEMQKSQAELFKKYEKENIYVPEGAVSAVTASITKLNEDLMAVQGRRIALEAAIKQVAQMRREGRSLETVPQVAADALAQNLSTQLATLNLDLSRLKEKYKEAHPEVQKLQAQITEMQKARAERARQIVGGLESELSQLRKQESDIRDVIGQQTAQAAAQSKSGAEVDAMRRRSESSKSLYDILLQKLNETGIASSMQANHVSLVEQAIPPRSPVRPRKAHLAGLGLLAGLLLGVGLVFGRDYLDNTLKDPDEVERYLHLDVLAAVPRYEDPGTHMVTEAYQNLRTALIFGRREEGGQVVLIAGTAPQEGKTTTLVNLATLLASAGERTVAVDLDLRRAQLHNRLRMSREPGVTTHFVQHEPLDTLIRPTKVPNLWVLTAGPLPPNPPALLARKAMGELMDELRRRFDWVILDSPPLASVTDAQLLARHADQAVLVVQYNHVDKKLVKRAVGQLRRASGALLGVVFNAVDYRAKGYTYYYYAEPGADGKKPSAPAKARTAAAEKR